MFFSCDSTGEQRVVKCLTCLLPLGVARGDRLPNTDELEVCLGKYEEFLAREQQSASALCSPEYRTKPEDSCFEKYIKMSMNLLCIISDLITQHQAKRVEHPMFSIQAERGFSFLHQLVLSILLDHSWDHTWQPLIASCIPPLQKILCHPGMTHYLISSSSLWIKLLLSLAEYQKQTQQKSYEASPENIFEIAGTPPHKEEENKRNVEYGPIVESLISSYSIQDAFERLMEILQFPPPPANSHSLSLQIHQKINRRVGIFLSLQLLRAGGIKAAVMYLIESNSESQNLVVDICCRVICKRPSFIPEAEWMNNYATQLKPMIVSSSRDNSLFSKIIWAITARLIELYPNSSAQFILNPITRPLRVYRDQFEVTNELDTPSVSESDMEGCIAFLWKLVCLHNPSQAVYQALTPLIPPLFRLYCFIEKTVLFMKKHVSEILRAYFSISSESSAMFKALIVPSSNDFCSHLDLRVNFAAGENGGVILRPVSGEQRDTLREAECITKLLKSCKNEELEGNLFIELLNELQVVPEHDERYLTLFQWLVQMLDEFGENILKNTVQVCTFLKAILNNKDEKILAISLAIISALLSGTTKLKEEEIILIYELEPELERIEMNYPDLSELASELRTKILVNDKASWVVPDEVESRSESIESLQRILQELSDPLLPVRGHGLIALRRLVLARNKEADANLQKILSIFRNQLDDNDTYIYGGAINGLTALGDVYPKEIIPILAQQAADTSRSVEQRLKVNESLLKISQRCGETLPFHVDPLIHTFLLACRDNDRTIRASGLSNIAELCKMLRFGLHPYLEEIVECVFALSTTDREVEVKRGCIFVLYLLLEGLGVDSFEMIPDHLAQVQKMIIQAMRDNDAVTCYHGERAHSYFKQIITFTPEEQKSPFHIL